jgi:hypothetical protein
LPLFTSVSDTDYSRKPGFRQTGFSESRPLYGARLQSDAFSGHLASVVRKSVEESSVRFLRRRFEQQPLPPPHPKPLSTSSSQPVPLRSLDVSLGFELARWSTRCPPPQPLRRSRGEALWPCSLLASLSPSCAAVPIHELPRRLILGNRASGIRGSRKLGFRFSAFSETPGQKEGRGIANASLALILSLKGYCGGSICRCLYHGSLSVIEYRPSSL